MCARPRLDARAVGRLRELLAQRLEWEEIFRLADGYRTIPLLATNLQRHGAALLTPALRQSLQRLHQESTRHNLALSVQLLQLLERFSAAGIRVAAFKGPVAAIAIYNDLAMRACGDLDLLVARADHAAAERLLQSLGYVVQQRHPAALQSCLTHNRHATAIDLHWGMPPASLHLRTRRLWEGLCTVALLQRSVPTFCGYDCLLICAINAVKEYWKPSLHHLSDMASLTTDYNREAWRAAFTRARELGCQRILAVALLLTHRVLATPLPPGAPARLLRSRTIHRLVDEVQAHLLPAAGGHAPDEDLKPRYYRTKTAYYLALTDSPWRRCRGWLRWAFKPGKADRSLLALPKGLRFLYYLLRPLRLLLKRF